jgi:hypothetical protein
MLSRTPSDAATRLRRSKSTSTVTQKKSLRSVPEHVNPWVAQQQALVAASTAYERAYGSCNSIFPEGRSQHDSIKTSDKLWRTRSKSNASKRSCEGSHFPPRTLPHIQDEVSIASHVQNRTEDSIKSDLTLANEKTVDNRGECLESPVTFFHHTSSDIPETPTRMSGRGSSQNTQMTAARIRKAKSMFYRSYHTRTLLDAQFPTAVSISGKADTSPAITLSTLTHDIQLKTDPLMPRSVNASDQVMQVRDRAHQSFSTRSGKERASFILAPFKKLQAQPRHTSQSASYGPTFDSNMQSDDVTASWNKSKGEKIRKFSGNLRDKFRKVFRRSSTTSSSAELPAQHVSATRPYYGKPLHCNPNVGSNGAGSPFDKVDDSITALPIVGVCSDTRSCTISAEHRQCSGTVAPTEKTESRVTSWTDSSMDSPTADLDDAAEHLSIIHEASRTSITVPSPIKLAFHPDRKKNQDVEPSHVNGNFPVEPKRIYSALLKEIARKDEEMAGIQYADLDQMRQLAPSAIDTLPSQSLVKPVPIPSLAACKRPFIRPTTPKGNLVGVLNKRASICSRANKTQIIGDKEECIDNNFPAQCRKSASVNSKTQCTTLQPQFQYQHNAKLPSDNRVLQQVRYSTAQ